MIGAGAASAGRLAANTALLLAAAAAAGSGCSRHNAPAPAVAGEGLSTPSKAALLDAARLAGADTEPGQWFTSGRDHNGSYYSPLTDINQNTVARLGFAWEYRLGTNRGLEATPIMIDGVLYAVGNWGRVYALDAVTGHALWTYDPDVDKSWGRFACCDAVNRGLAAWRGRVYVGSTDGWLHCIDATTGRRLWKVDTLIGRDRRPPYTITGAPQIAGDLVVIGNGGADFGVRGYVSAYDVESGTLRWRFYTVPRDPRLGPQDQPHLERAATTWDPDTLWKLGGGGTVWDGMAYDPSLDLLYIGTGNASPYNWHERSPKGGDNLYLASIIAIHARTGEMAWYYQEVPRESWDYTATMKMVLADITIAGRRRQVIMQAPKNGIFYVLDRATGELLSAKNYTYVNWTRGVDLKSGRPVSNPLADYDREPRLVFPSQAGAHNWQPMSFSPQTGLVYIPVIDMPMVYVNTSLRPAGLVEGTFTAPGITPEAYNPTALAPLFGELPALAMLEKAAGAPGRSRGELRAWNPSTGLIAWSQPVYSTWDGGVLSTAGRIVIRGDAAGRLNVHSADDGRLLKVIDVGTSIMAAPMTYKVGDVQYVAVMAGYGGAGGMAFPPGSAAYDRGNEGRIVAFRLGGAAVPLPPKVDLPPIPLPPALQAAPGDLAKGGVLYNRYCSRCHFFDRGMLPDLRRMAAATHAIFPQIVLHGAFASKGMAGFADVLSGSDANDIHAYIASEASKAYEAQQRALLQAAREQPQPHDR